MDLVGVRRTRSSTKRAHGVAKWERRRAVERKYVRFISDHCEGGRPMNLRKSAVAIVGLVGLLVVVLFAVDASRERENSPQSPSTPPSSTHCLGSDLFELRRLLVRFRKRGQPHDERRRHE